MAILGAFATSARGGRRPSCHVQEGTERFPGELHQARFYLDGGKLCALTAPPGTRWEKPWCCWR